LIADEEVNKAMDEALKGEAQHQTESGTQIAS